MVPLVDFRLIPLYAFNTWVQDIAPVYGFMFSFHVVGPLHGSPS